MNPYGSPSNPWSTESLSRLSWRDFADCVSERFGNALSYKRGEFIDLDVLNSVCADFGNEYGQLTLIAHEFRILADDEKAGVDAWWATKVVEARARAKEEGTKITSDTGADTAAQAYFGEERLERMSRYRDLDRRADFLSKWKHIFDVTAGVIETGSHAFQFRWRTIGGLQPGEMENPSPGFPASRMERRPADEVGATLSAIR